LAYWVLSVGDIRIAVWQSGGEIIEFDGPMVGAGDVVGCLALLRRTIVA
jgi:hypothetical protein